MAEMNRLHLTVAWSSSSGVENTMDPSSSLGGSSMSVYVRYHTGLGSGGCGKTRGVAEGPRSSASVPDPPSNFQSDMRSTSPACTLRLKFWRMAVESNTELRS